MLIYKHFKRIIDIILSFMGLIIISPMLILTAIFIRIKLGSPVFFTQKRPGLKGKIFKMIKFRSMLNTRNENGDLLPDRMRKTKLGNFIRSSSIDELPGLINVLKGDMSLVGPRPLLTEYLPLYNEQQARRHDVRPGITGLAQVSGRNAITWEEKFSYDVKYVDNMSLFLDIKILILTLKKVFVREGINYESETINNRFTGTK
ncbi:MAG: sugar transferase [Candidatus Delongbacteria bacterium]|jgi:lipopolysaccharide/colanic/teichoic acid biosynthesis glycosyltransferase|nr:sugar transferase [Candidatus Delongbacteria bacterium]